MTASKLVFIYVKNHWTKVNMINTSEVIKVEKNVKMLFVYLVFNVGSKV